MAKNMTFEVDRRTVCEGDVVEVRWDCTGADRVELKIDNGFKASVIALDLVGTKRFRLNRSKGRTALTVTAWLGNRSGSKTIKVRVKEPQAVRAETVDAQGRTVSSAKESWQRLQQRWRALPPDKRLASRIAMFMCGALLVGLLFPPLFMIGLAVVMGYLLYYIWKR